MKKQDIGDLQFWRECIVHYRLKAKEEKSLKKRIVIAKCLNDARGYLKYAESKILVIVLVLIIILCSSCVSTIRGVGQATKGIGQGAGDFLIEEMEGK